jgi:hypothetical protein
MSRIVTLEPYYTQFTQFGQPLGEPRDPASTTPIAQRALNLLNHCAYRTRPHLFGQQVGIVMAVPSVSVTVFRWRGHAVSGVPTWVLLAYGRQSATGATVSLKRNGTTVATVTLPTGTNGTVSDESSVLASGDATWEIVIDGIGSPSGNIIVNAVWVTYPNLTVP